MKGRLGECEAILKQALDKEGDIDEVNYNLSLNYARRGNINEAILRMQECIRLDPKYPNAVTWLNDLINLKKELGE